MSAARLLLLAALLTLACALLAPLFLAHADNVPPEPNTCRETTVPDCGDCFGHQEPHTQ